MSKIETGGPAFPVPGLQYDESFNGMTLREYAAITMRVPQSGTVASGGASVTIRSAGRECMAKR